MSKRRRQAILVVVILVVGLGGAMFIPGFRRLLVSSNNDKAFALMNHDRTSNSRYPALAHQSQLQSYAQNWSNHMAAQGYTQHDSIERHICCWDALGENVGTGPSIEAIEDAFMHSPEHRRNILYPTFTQAGVGVAYNAKQRAYYVTQAFRDPSGSSSPRPRTKPRPRPRPRAVRTSAPRVTPTRTPRSSPSPTPSVTPSPTVTPSPSILAPPPITSSPTPVRPRHHRSVLSWIIIGILVAFIAGMVILVAFGLPRRPA